MAGAQAGRCAAQTGVGAQIQSADDRHVLERSSSLIMCEICHLTAKPKPTCLPFSYCILKSNSQVRYTMPVTPEGAESKA